MNVVSLCCLTYTPWEPMFLHGPPQRTLCVVVELCSDKASDLAILAFEI